MPGIGVAGAVGISRGNFYYHFKTKDEILAVVIGAEPDRDSCNLVMMVATTEPSGKLLSFGTRPSRLQTAQPAYCLRCPDHRSGPVR